MRAIWNGFSVAFCRLDDLLAALECDAGVSLELLHHRKLLNAALLVVDVLATAILDRLLLRSHYACRN